MSKSQTDTNEWKRKAQEQQNQYCEELRLPAYFRFDEIEDSSIMNEISLAFFGEPVDENGYTSKQRSLAKKLTKKVISISRSNGEAGTIYMAIVYVSCKSKKDHFCEPVIRVLKSRNANGSANNWFVDRNVRVYDGWHDWLDHNKLKKCLYCYPRDGIYQTREDGLTALVEFGESPASKSVAKVIKGAYVITGIMSSLEIIVLALQLITTVPETITSIASVLAVTAAVCLAGLYVFNFIDKYRHKESLCSCSSLTSWSAIIGLILDIIFF